ncbi:SusC/RagA family TonB-linked outer membrane protein [Roseimarinus sediminis]|uniref:SusC/RagA family TonB-linked outer membrane protein n=1 Tax=Roseimarinus sediminis TaxID=1610899 RepID=UPI003D1B46FE
MRMKQLIGVMVFLLSQQLLWAQNITVTGNITDTSGEPLPGVTVFEKSTGNGTVSNFDGVFSIEVSADATLRFSFVGYQTIEEAVNGRSNINIRLSELVMGLDEVVAIGYGTQRKSDLTGSVSSVSSDNFQEGLISSPEQLINGKVSGVQIMSGNGSPNSGSTIRIRGGASLNASNDPLIVLDGLPLERGGISGNSNNFMSLINPNDIENITILKDASSTAIYGSRASNGVIMITTKKGSNERLKASFTSTNSIQTLTRLPEMLSTNQFIDAINTYGTADQKALLGTADTNWNNEVFQSAMGTDNNLSLSGQFLPNTPVRVSLGYYLQNGILKTDQARRMSGNLSVSPSFFDDHLKFTLNAKGSQNNNTFANTGAIWAASTFNPTLEVYSGNNNFGAYTEAIDNSGLPVNAAVRNPLGLIEQYDSRSQVNRLVGNIDMDYKLHFLPELKFHSTMGYDYAKGQGTVFVPAEATQYYTTTGRDFAYGPQKNINRLLTTYLNYNKYFDALKSTVEATLGYDYQFWKTTTPAYSELNTLGEIQNTNAPRDQRHALLSYYARFNYSYDSRYLLTASFRRDGTSRFSEDMRWGTFPSLAMAWRVSEEAFLKDSGLISNLKFRASYGITGQQDGIGNYSYLPVYTYSQDGAQVQFGDLWYHTYRPEAYVSNLKWEKTKSWNTGFDLGMFNERLTASVDYYNRQTEDLLATVPVPAGSNFDKRILTNVGNVDSRGVELVLTAIPVDTRNLKWNISFNATWQQMVVKNLSLVDGGEASNTLVGPTIDTYHFQVLTEGYEPYMFYLYHQLYDETTGIPVERAYADLNKDRTINSSDLYRYNSPAPDFLFGLSTSVNYKNWNIDMSFRANAGNYVYNGMAMNAGAWSTVSYNSYQLNKLSKSFLDTRFRNRQYLSDYYVENASFLKMDNLSINYNFGKINNWCSLNLSAMVQNVFTITNYTGVDPEVPQGMDLSFYPRPRTYSLALGLNF